MPGDNILVVNSSSHRNDQEEDVDKTAAEAGKAGVRMDTRYSVCVFLKKMLSGIKFLHTVHPIDFSRRRAETNCTADTGSPTTRAMPKH